MAIFSGEYKLTVGLCITGLALLLLASWLAEERLTSYARAETEQSLVSVLDTTHQAVRSWVRAHRATAQVWANTPEVRSAARELSAAIHDGSSLVAHPAQQEVRRLLRPVLNATGYDGYFIVGADGTNLASSRDVNIGWRSLLNAQQSFLTRIQAGDTAISLPQRSDVALYDHEGTLRGELPTMFVGAPIVDEHGEFSALIAFRIDPREDFTTILRQGRLGQSGETYAFDSNARLISNSRFEDQLKSIGIIAADQSAILNVELRDPGTELRADGPPLPRRANLPHTRMAESAIAGESGVDLDGYRDYRGVEVVGVWTWDPELDFGLATEIDKLDAYATLRLASLVTLFLSGLAGGLLVMSTTVFVVSRTRATRVQDALRESEAQNRSVLRSLTAHIAVLDSDGDITAVNDAWDRFAGDNDASSARVSPGTGLNYLDVCRHATGAFSEEANAAADGIEAVLQGRETLFTLEYPCHSPDKERWFLLYATPLSTTHGGAVVTHINITERKLAEREVLRYQNQLEGIISERSRELVLSEEQLRDLYENAPVSYLTIAAKDDAIIRHNRALVQLLGYDSQEVARLRASDLYADCESGASLAHRVHAQARSGCSVKDVEMVMKRRDSSRVWVSVSMTPKTDTTGDVVETRCAILDVTTRKLAEQHLRLTEKIFEDTAEAILITDANKCIVDMNDAFCAVSGYDRDELIGRTPAMLSAGRHDNEFYRRMWETLTASGHWRGELWDRRKNGEAYPSWTSISAVRNDSGTITHYVGIVSDITTIKQTEKRLEQLAHFDQLTGLANRMLFHDRLRSALTRADRHREALAVIYIDLDGFKQVNDTLGHQAGDELLKSAADALRTCVREEDTLARLGGDEFAIILGELELAKPDAELVAARVVEALRLGMPFGERELRVSASVGVALYPADGQDLVSVLRNADQAMYHAKENGKDRYEFFNPVINARVIERIHLKSDLQTAIDDKQLFIEYQPVLDLESRRVTSLEALVRWRHPLRGVVPPGEFIAFAEETGLIIPIGEYVLAHACEDLRRWRTSEIRNIPVALNLSVMQFRDNDFAEDLERLIVGAGVAFNLLHLEVTESLVMENLTRSVDLLNSLKSMGVRISIDDFGTGYSSLSSLSRLPVDVLKIDRSFVSRIPFEANNSAIVAAIISMAHALDKIVIAEGVETAEQLSYLLEQRCDEAQGFLFGRPVPVDRVAHEIKRIERQAHPVELSR